MPKVAMVVSTVGYYWEEVVAAYVEFKRAGLDVVMFTVDGSAPKADPVSQRITGPLALFGYGAPKAIGPMSRAGQMARKGLSEARLVSEWIRLQFAGFVIGS